MINLINDTNELEEKKKPEFLGVERQRDLEKKNNKKFKKKNGKLKSPYNYNGKKYFK